MVDFPRFFRTAANDRTNDPEVAQTLAVGIVNGSIGGPERFASIAALFPHVAFRSVGDQWPDRPDPSLDVLVVGVGASDVGDVEAAVRRLAADHGHVAIVVTLLNADVMTTRRLMRAGAADVLPVPISEPALALCLERLLAGGGSNGGPKRKSGEVVAVLKAGGGVGATALGVQMSAILAARGSGEICIADLDLQFGSVGVYLDLPEAVTIADCLGSGPGLAETPFSTALTTHRSGVRMLAAPREIVALETLNPDLVNALLVGLRRDFALTVVDLPANWTAWTNHVVAQADRIILVTHLSVPHVQLAKRQLRILASQQLDDHRLIMVCNCLSSDQAAAIPLKAAERALGRAFDVVVPEDRKLMNATLNQGVEIAAVRRGTRLEKAIGELADKAAARAPTREAR
jgi:pilus assembly protein CpaE